VSEVARLFDILRDHERKLGRSFSLIPSENQLSPLARLAFTSDAFSRNFFNEKEVFGRWSFQGGSIAGRIQTEILVPLSRQLGGAAHVNVHPVSGLSGMTLVLAAFGRPGATVLSVPVANGGHPDTAYVARKLGMTWSPIPFADWATIDEERLAERVRDDRPCLIYIDHATHLFPLDLTRAIGVIRGAAVEPVHVHVDTSHVNGLIWGGVLPNPLACGADTYGGSTHKTFPGPHKAVLFTNDAKLDEQLILTAVNMISHHHTASVISLAIAMLEFEHCDGRAYARQIVANARAFARALEEHGFAVQGRGGVHTANHQVWLAAPPGRTAHEAGAAVFDAGIIVNPYDPLPSLGGVGIRTGVAEATKLGMVEADMRALATLLARVWIAQEPPAQVARDVESLRARFRPSYCYDLEMVERCRGRLREGA
jgi:glycine/serine hydroxymethyltransferase